MRNRIGITINANPIENGFIVIVKYADVVRTCHCEDFDSVESLITEICANWKERAEEIMAAADEDPAQPG
jgi:hypothetical protein